MKKLSILIITLLLSLAAAQPKLCKPKKHLRQAMKKCKFDADCPQLKCAKDKDASCLEYACHGRECVLLKESLPAPVQCGHLLCGKGQECCNESCGICVEKGGFCTQQFCGPIEPENHSVPKVAEPAELECNINEDCPVVNCIKAPCPSLVCENHHCIIDPFIEQCKRDLDCPQRHDKCIGGQCLRLEVLPLPTFDEMECEDSYDCPQVRCMAGVPCPSYECVKGKCVAEYETFSAALQEEKECSRDLHCPQPLCMPGTPCPTYVCIGGACVAKVELQAPPIDELNCSEDFQCPQPSCLVGTPCPFFVCEKNRCEAKYEGEPPMEPVICGRNLCKGGDVCCNASCGICTPHGGMCTQQACGHSYEKCNVDSDCSGREDHCIEGKCVTRMIETLPSALGCEKDFECPQPACAAGYPCPFFVCRGGECVAEFTEPIPTASMSQSGGMPEEDAIGDFIECGIDGDCPPIACAKEPCPCSVCVDQKCTIRGHAGS